MNSDYKYKRVLLKLSGEALMGEEGYGIRIRKWSKSWPFRLKRS